MPDASTMNRRTFAALVAAAICYPENTHLLAQPQATPAASQSPRPAPVALGHNLEIRDIRLFPTPDVPRFLIELYSDNDIHIDAPSVGATIGESALWAVPYAPVVYPYDSMLLIGVLPDGVTTIEQLLSADWMLCSEYVGAGFHAKTLERWDVSVEWTTSTLPSKVRRNDLTIENHSKDVLWQVFVVGLVWDENNRLCGGTLRSTLTGMMPDAKLETASHLSTAMMYVANPFVLENNPDNMTVTFTVQPEQSPTQPGCPAALPWNR